MSEPTPAAEQAARLRAGAARMRSAVNADAWAIPLMAGALEEDADRLDRGEYVDGLAESLALADTFVEHTTPPAKSTGDADV